MRIDNEDERSFYEIEAAKNNWSVRELQRQLDSELYTRLTLSRDKNKVRELSEKGLIIEQPNDAIKRPLCARIQKSSFKIR
jgi:predicted nuclease of restriction endonuclease-like (RecB) superfamily